MTRTAVLVACDAGGAGAVAAVASALAADGRLDVVAFAAGPALDAFARGGIVAHPITTDAEAEGSARMAMSGPPAVVVCGTSVGALEPEKRFIAAARAAGVPSLAVVDAWSRYAERFSTPGAPLSCLPDRIAAIDERSVHEMAAAGIPADRVVVTGDPRLDGLADLRAATGSEAIAAMRREAGASDADLLVLYVPGPLETPFDAGTPFTERDVARTLAHSLATLARARDRSVVLVVRPHPRDTGRVTALDVPPPLRCAVMADRSAAEWALASDLVVGTHTHVLVEAAHLGRIAVSIQPGIGDADPLPTNATGRTIAVYRDEEVIPTLERALFDDAFRSEHEQRLAVMPAAGGATRRVVELAFSLAGATARP